MNTTTITLDDGRRLRIETDQISIPSDDNYDAFCDGESRYYLDGRRIFEPEAKHLLGGTVP